MTAVQDPIIGFGDSEDALPKLTDVERLSNLLSADFLEHYGVLPLRSFGNRVVVATWLTDVEPEALDELATLFDANVELVRKPEQDVRTAIRRAYSEEAFTAQRFQAHGRWRDGA